MSFYSLSATFGSPIVIGTQAISRNMQSSQNSQASQYLVPSRYAYNAPHKHISELMSCANVCTMSTLQLLICFHCTCLVSHHLSFTIQFVQDEVVTTVGTTHHGLTAKRGWFLLTCVDCKKQIITTSPSYKCSNEHVTPDPQIKLIYYVLFL